mmetsp:Transcript_5964/g.13204  ORF Transcript_5964/g.13204 Transcript_5964/m.13204 type:complete len:123 (-) Transcript_5964:32-400(-)
MQRDFDNLMCDVTSMNCPAENCPAESLFSQCSVNNTELDIKSLKEEYKNISEEALVFLTRWQRAAANRPLQSRKKQLASIEPDEGNDGIDEIRLVSSTCAFSLLPPPKRFFRAPRGPTQTAK